MPLRMLIDEDSRSDALWDAIQSHNKANASFSIDVVRIGDIGCLRSGSSDARVIVWASRNDRLIISQDKKTLVNKYYEFINLGLDTAGLFIVKPGTPILELKDFLVASAYILTREEICRNHRFVPGNI